ncbi:MAG: hypothetical protein KJ077_09595 [Anaerolineae bacterium]|nr:hypothetical protein [Anaerolineae bacterium]
MQRLPRLVFRMFVVVISVVLLLIGGITFSRATSGAPILLVVNDSPANPNKFGRYLGEILRAEGLNSFEIIDVSALNAGILSDHDLTILAETSLSAGQASLLNDYVNNNNGRLIAMRPDSQIKALFGLGSANGSLVDGYVRINTSAVLSGTIPGQGLSSETLQIHGTADQYSPSGGTVLAQLYSNASTSTSYPAVIAGSSGRAVAFTYDLAWNVIYTRQGNPANAGVNTDGDLDEFGNPIIRTIDLFQAAGGGTPWVDLDRIHIPQADEQQRLLARLVRQLVGEVRPLPQLWYFPGTAKTMLILTADAHGNPTSFYQDEINSLNARGATATFYLALAAEPFEEQPGSNNDVLDWVAQGHTFGIHPYWYKPDDHEPYNITNLAEGYNAYDLWFGLQYPNVPKSLTVRNHQIAWTGWTDAAEIAEAHGYRLDTNFYHWGAWLQKPDGSWPHGYVTGSGQPMKFMGADGQLINVYQQLTQLVDEQMLRPPDYAFENLSPTQAITVSKQLINASLGGDYAALMTQFHVDYYTGQPAQEWAEGTVDYANSQGVPVWNADQWLTFTETRHDANYGNIAWDDVNKVLTFNLSATLTTGVDLTTVLPLNYRGNDLEAITVDGLTANFSTETIKGIDVAFVGVPAGNHSFVAHYHDNTTPTLSLNDVTVTEGNVGSTAAVFTATLSKASVQTVTVNYDTVNGSALAPADYIAASGVLTFAPGVLTRPLTVTIQGDTLHEPDEVFQVNLGSPVNASIGDGQGVGTIIDDDAGPVLNINDVSVTEGNGGTVSAVFSVTLTAVSGQTVTVNYSTADESALAPADYIAASGVLTFAPGVLTRPLTVTIQGDTLHEPDEVFQVNLGSPVNASIGDGQGVGTIIDDDAGPVLNINDVSVTEGNGGTVSAVFSVTLTAVSGQTVTVNYSTADESALAPADYIAASGVLTFAPGVLTRPLTVMVKGDTLVESAETFLVNLTNPVNANFGDNRGQGIIVNDDQADVTPEQKVFLPIVVK